MSKPAAKKLFRTSANVSEHLKLRALSYHCHMMIWNRPPLECILVHSRTRQRHPRSSGRPLSHHCWGFEVLGRSPNLLLRTQETLFICQNVTVPRHKWKLICVYIEDANEPRERNLSRFMLRINSVHFRPLWQGSQTLTSDIFLKYSLRF